MKTLLKLCLVAALTLAVPGCALFRSGGVMDAIANVLTYAEDADQRLTQIETTVNIYFMQKPDPELQRQIGLALSKARSAISIALKTAKGAEELAEDDLAAAFRDFRAAYRDLMALLEDSGFLGADGTFGAAEGKPSVAGVGIPMAMSTGSDK